MIYLPKNPIQLVDDKYSRQVFKEVLDNCNMFLIYNNGVLEITIEASLDKTDEQVYETIESMES